MTPLELGILLHYHCKANDYRNGYGRFSMDAKMNLRLWLAQKIAGPNFYVVEGGWLDDLQYRFSCVLDRVTTTMSKTNYSLPLIYAEIDAHEDVLLEDLLEDHLEPWKDLVREMIHLKDRGAMHTIGSKEWVAKAKKMLGDK